MEHRRTARPEAQRTNNAPAALEPLKALAWLLDSSIRLPGGFRIGVDALIGLIPVIGDAVGMLLSSYIVTRAAKLGVPRSVLLRMAVNVAIEGVVGMLPVVGDIFDAAWKANQRNVNLLLRQAEQPEETHRASRWFVALTGLALIAMIALLLVGSLLLIRWAWPGGGGPA